LLRSLADGTHRDPSLAGMPFIRLPWLEVITYSEQIESRLVRSDTEFNQFGYGKLLMRQLKTDLSCEP
jgi:hypothetical protein